MKVIFYHRVSLCDSEDVEDQCLRWARRRRLKVALIVREHSERARKLQRLLGALTKDTLVVAYSPYSFGSLPVLIAALPRICRSGASLVFVKESIALRGGGNKLRSFAQLCELLLGVESERRRENKKRGLMIAKWIGRRLGRESLSDEIRAEAIRLLNLGQSSRQVVKEMGGRIGRTSVQKIARELHANRK